MLSSVFSVWNPSSLGYYSFNTDTTFEIIIGILNFPSTSFWIKISLVVILFVAGFSMYWLLKNYFEVSAAAAACAGLFYMLTPVMFTRVIVGYYGYLIGYAVLPLIFFTFVYGVKNKSVPPLLLCGVLFGFAAMQIQFAVLVPVLLFLYILFQREYLFRGISDLCLVIGVFCLVQLPLVIYYLTTVLTPETSFNQMASSAQYIWIYFYPPQLSDALMLFGKDYEFLFLQYFQNRILFLPFLASALILPVIAFSMFRRKKALPFIILGILTIILMLGTNPPFGVLYQWAYEKIPLAGLFRTSYHWAVLLAFSYAILLGMAYDQIAEILLEKKELSRWIRDALIVAGCVFLVYLGYILSNIPSLTGSLEKREIPPYFIDIGICLCSALLILFYLNPDVIISRFIEKTFWQKNCRTIFCLIFLGMVLVYAWPFFTGNFTGRLQLYSYDQEYQALFTNLQQEQGDFRILWLPMISPIQYDGYQYPGHDSLIAYSPKPSFPQIISSYDTGSKYTTYLANLQYTNDTEYFGDVLDTTSAKYVIYRNDFTPVLPSYLPFGTVDGFVWNNTAPYDFLQHQKDLKNTETGTNYTIWENNFTPRLSAQVPFTVAGDLSTAIGLSYSRPILGYEQVPALLYLEERNTGGYQDLAKTVVVDNNRDDDLLFSFVNSSYICDAGWYTQEIDARNGWTTTFDWWWNDTQMSAQPEYGAFTLQQNATLRVNPSLPPGTYSVFVKMRSGPDSSSINYTLDTLQRTFTPPRNEDTYLWYPLGSYNLSSTDLTVQSSGRNEIESVAFVPGPELENARIKTSRYLVNRSIVLIDKPENFNQTLARYAFGTSRGYVELPAQTNFTFNISVPKETGYSGYLRIRAHDRTYANITVDNIRSSVALSPSENFTWVPVTNMTLSRGLHSFTLQSPAPLDFDMLVFKSTDYQYQSPDVTVTYNQTQGIVGTDPTLFSITSESQEPYFLVFNENYHPAWKLTDPAGSAFDDFQVNYYANGYYVNSTGNTTLNLQFTYQTPYLVSVIVSQVGLIILILLIAILYWRKEKVTKITNDD
jgi:hypothetical protein